MARSSIIDIFRRALRRPGSQGPAGLVMAEGVGQRHIEISGGTRAYELLYEHQPAVGAVVNKLVRQISTLPIKVYREDGEGERTELHGHPLGRLLHNPIEFVGADAFGQWASLPALVYGNSLLVKVRGQDGLPIGLLPVDWRFVSAYAEPGEQIKLWSTTQTGEELYIMPSEALHFGWHGPRGLGVSPLAQLAKTLHLEDSAVRYQISSFDKGIRPSGAVVLDGDVDPESENAKRMRAALKKLNEGVDNAGALMLLGGGADFKAMSMTAVEADLILQRKLNREEVEMVYDTPPPVVQDLEHGTTYENADALHRHFYKTSLRPWLGMIEMRLKAQLIDPEPDWRGLCARFDLSEVLRGDPAEEITAVAEAKREGIITTNEGRRKLGLSPSSEPEADKLLVQTNNTGQLSETSGDEPVAVSTPE